MDGQPEVLRDPLDQNLGLQALFLAACRFDEGHHLGGDLVRSVRSPFGRQQPRQTGPFEICLDLVKSRPGDPEARRDVGNALTLGAYPTQHLVTHLHQIPRIEEIAADESGILHVLRMRIHGAALCQRKELEVGFEGVCHV